MSRIRPRRFQRNRQAKGPGGPSFSEGGKNWLALGGRRRPRAFDLNTLRDPPSEALRFHLHFGLRKWFFEPRKSNLEPSGVRARHCRPIGDLGSDEQDGDRKRNWIDEVDYFISPRWQVRDTPLNPNSSRAIAVHGV